MDIKEKAAPLPRRGKVKYTLLQKLVMGYSSLALFIMAALLFSAGGLYSLNRTARDIATNYLPAINSLTGMRNSLIAQEGFVGKFAILRSSEYRDLFKAREKDFLEKLSLLVKTGGEEDVAELKRLYQEYMKESERFFAGGGEERVEQIAVQLFDTLETIYSARQRNLQERLQTANSQERISLRLTMGFSLTGLLLAIFIAIGFTYRTFSAVKTLRKATQRIAEGDFDYHLEVPSGDELGELADDFSRMAARLKELEQMSLDASPLTRLPGNIAIERVIEKRLRDGGRFALCYADLDNFKSFTDTYGYVKGSEMIRLTGEIIYESVKESGDKNAFVGHIGGDDFIMVLSDDRVVPVCESVIKAFDAEVVRHYSPEDLARGGIEGPDRYGVQRFFPIMTISIAVIINEAGEYSTSVELAKTASEIKDYAKEKPGSNYLISHRRKNPR